MARKVIIHFAPIEIICYHLISPSLLGSINIKKISEAQAISDWTGFNSGKIFEILGYWVELINSCIISVAYSNVFIEMNVTKKRFMSLFPILRGLYFKDTHIYV